MPPSDTLADPAVPPAGPTDADGRSDRATAAPDGAEAAAIAPGQPGAKPAPASPPDGLRAPAAQPDARPAPTAQSDGIAGATGQPDGMANRATQPDGLAGAPPRPDARSTAAPRPPRRNAPAAPLADTPRIYIDGRFLTQPASGIQRYAEEVVRAIDAMGITGTRPGRWTLLTPPGARPLPLATIATRTVGRRAGHGWTQVAFARAARDGVALSLAASGPVWHRRALVVIHDAAVYAHPEFYGRVYGLAHRLLGRVLARTARIATVSAFSRAELARALGLAPAAIQIAPNGADHLAAKAGAAAASDVIARLGLTGRAYFVTLGNQTPAKNLGLAVRAIALLGDNDSARLGENYPALVMIGAGNAKVFGTQTAPKPPTPARNVIRPGRLPDADVIALLRGARALVFPSLYEGFGIPPLEAMANGCPVLASTAGAVREVCGDAAAYVAPTDDAALADLMRAMLTDEPRRAGLIARGAARVAAYRWADAAAVLVDACVALAGAGAAP